jgi:hypothetical protein
LVFIVFPSFSEISYVIHHDNGDGRRLQDKEEISFLSVGNTKAPSRTGALPIVSSVTYNIDRNGELPKGSVFIDIEVMKEELCLQRQPYWQ